MLKMAEYKHQNLVGWWGSSSQLGERSSNVHKALSWIPSTA